MNNDISSEEYETRLSEARERAKYYVEGMRRVPDNRITELVERIAKAMVDSSEDERIFSALDMEESIEIFQQAYQLNMKSQATHQLNDSLISIIDALVLSQIRYSDTLYSYLKQLIAMPYHAEILKVFNISEIAQDNDLLIYICDHIASWSLDRPVSELCDIIAEDLEKYKNMKKTSSKGDYRAGDRIAPMKIAKIEDSSYIH